MNNLLGIYEKAFINDLPMKKKLEYTNMLGFDFMELSIDESDEKIARLDLTDLEIFELRNEFELHNVLLTSICLSANRKYPLGSLDEVTRKRGIEILNNAIIFAHKLGIRNIQLAGYDVYYEKSNLETEKLFVSGLKNAVELASKYQIMLSIEIMDTNFIGTLCSCKKYISLVDSNWLKMYLDIGNLYQHTFDYKLEIMTFIKDIVQIHIKDTDVDLFRGLSLGEGNVPIADIKKILNDLRYNGPLVLEIWAKSDMTIEENLDFINKNKKYFQEL